MTNSMKEIRIHLLNQAASKRSFNQDVNLAPKVQENVKQIVKQHLKKKVVQEVLVVLLH